MIESDSGSVAPHGAAASTVNAYAVGFVAVLAGNTVGYVDVACVTWTYGEVDDSVALTAVAFAPPLLTSWTRSCAEPPGSNASLPIGVSVWVFSSRYTAVGAPALRSASGANARPAPLSRSVPEASMSSAPVLSALRICAEVAVGTAALIRPAIAATCGAAADVP